MQESTRGNAWASAIGAATLAATLLLGGCGGGGSGGDGPPLPLEVAVMVDGVADAGNPLTAGESTTIDVPSGATLQFDSANRTRWSPQTTTSTFHVDSFSFTSKSMTVTSNAGGTLVVVFTNKDDEAQTATLTVHVAAQEFQAAARVDGEIEAWSDSYVHGDGSTEEDGTLYRAVLAQDGSYALDTADASTPGTYSQRELYDARGRDLGTSFPSVGTSCLYDRPVVQVSYPMHVGKTWSGKAKRQCVAGSRITTQSYRRTVQAYERITVPQGTHDVLRVHSDVSYAVTNDPNSPDYSTESTCWWAVDLGRNVKCRYVTHFDDGSSSTSTHLLTALTH